jgi:hypothetical protein
MANESSPGVDYHLARSCVRISGTRTVTTDGSVSPPVTTEAAEASIDVVTEADPVFAFGIQYDGGWVKDVSLDLAFTDDLRITSSGATSKGRAGDAVKGTLAFVTSLAATAASLSRGVAIRGVTEAEAVTKKERKQAPAPKTAEECYADERPAASAGRADTAKAVATVRAALVANDAALATVTGAAKIKEAVARSRALGDALARLEAQYAAMESRFQAWRTAKQSKEESELTFVVPVAELPKAEAVDAVLAAPPADVLGPCFGAYEDLHTVVAVTDVAGHKDERDIDPNVHSFFQGVFYRKPRVVELSVYGREPGKPALRLTQRTRHVVVDDRCERRFVKFDKSAWGDRAVTLTFGDLGQLTKVSSSSTGDAAAVAQTLADLPASVKDALSQGSAIAGELDTIRNAGIDRELARLKKESELLNQRIANDVEGADTAALRELAELQHRKDLLTARKDVAGLEPGPTPAPAPAAPTTASGRTIVITIDGDPAE